MLVKKDNAVEFVSLDATNLPPEQKEMLVKTLTGMMSQVNKLNNLKLTLKEPVAQQVSLDIPFPSGLGTMTFNVITTYTLNKIQDGIAYIDSTAQYVMDSNMTKLNMDGSGSGNGTLEYLVNEKQIKKMETLSNINMKVTLGDMTVIVQSDSIDKSTYTLIKE